MADNEPVPVADDEPVPDELDDAVPVWLPVSVELLEPVRVELDDGVPVWLPVPVELDEPVPVALEERVLAGDTLPVPVGKAVRDAEAVTTDASRIETRPWPLLPPIGARQIDEPVNGVRPDPATQLALVSARVHEVPPEPAV